MQRLVALRVSNSSSKSKSQLRSASNLSTTKPASSLSAQILLQMAVWSFQDKIAAGALQQEYAASHERSVPNGDAPQIHYDEASSNEERESRLTKASKHQEGPRQDRSFVTDIADVDEDYANERPMTVEETKDEPHPAKRRRIAAPEALTKVSGPQADTGQEMLRSEQGKRMPAIAPAEVDCAKLLQEPGAWRSQTRRTADYERWLLELVPQDKQESTYSALQEFFGLPQNPEPVMYNGQLMHGDGAKDHSSGVKKAQAYLRTGLGG